MSKMLILCTTLLCAAATHAANKPASELVWTEAEEEGCRGNVCVNNDSNKKPDMFSRLDKTERQLLTDPYSKYDRDSSSTARAGVTFKWD
ncbi:hypothetical protein KC222_10790 [Cedecea davisae]|uniref:Secreted protein n=1 Tax=Cedecea davisae TaxID=158484 RepID=A0ABS6DI30_9ENTR|nr:hypothetical protein [Cedecea davisae]MBU4682501.1 hypothetical protein [Cedecea davisae]MBU4688065.1 hypothetical protein [Cedecea davisae]